MKLLRTAVIAGLAHAVIVPATVQASDPIDPSSPASANEHLLPTGHRFLPGLGRNVVLVELSVSRPGDSRHLTVTESGRVVVESGRPIQKRTWTLSGSKLDQLESALVWARFWSLRSHYGTCHDCTSYSITYSGLTVQSRVPNAEAAVIPSRLAPALSLLRRLAYAPRVRST